MVIAASRRRSPATLPGFHAGRPPRNKGFRYPPDPPRVEESVAVMRQAGETEHGLRVRGLLVVLWRAGLRIGEAVALTEPDLDAGRGSILVRQGKGGKWREVGMDDNGVLQPGAGCRPMAVAGRQASAKGSCPSMSSELGSPPPQQRFAVAASQDIA